MNEAELRARIRELLKSGALPRMLPGAPFKSGLPTAAINMQFGAISGPICLACGESAPTVTYSYPSGRWPKSPPGSPREGRSRRCGPRRTGGGLGSGWSSVGWASSQAASWANVPRSLPTARQRGDVRRLRRLGRRVRTL
jgi:hypothetical protein